MTVYNAKYDEYEINKVEKDVNNTIDSMLLTPAKVTNDAAKEIFKPFEDAAEETRDMAENIEAVNDALRSAITRILFSTRHANIGEAILADIVDIIPGLGDITEAERLSDARRLGDHDAVVAHGMDTFGEIFDIIPVVGELMDSALDALVPANTLLYLKRKDIIDWKPPLPPVPKIGR